MPERTTVRLPAALLTRAKRKAAAEGRSLTALIEDGLRMVVADKRKPVKRKGLALPVSSATGGPRSGFATLIFSELQELDDLDYVERMKRLSP